MLQLISCYLHVHVRVAIRNENTEVIKPGPIISVILIVHANFYKLKSWLGV